MKAIRTLIVDDEPLARDGLRLRLAAEDDVEIAGEAVDGPSAVHAIESIRPDLVFLDVQMPGMDGFEVLEATAEKHLPAVIFVTAYDEYAIRAFEVHALDYLLKPVSADRLEEALRRVRKDLAREEDGDIQERLANLLENWKHEGTGEAGALRDSSGYVYRFAVRDRDRFVLIKSIEIDWIESAANYARLHARGTSFLIRSTMSELEKRLDPKRFARIHRSTIVNIDRIKEIRPDAFGDFDVLLDKGATLRLSRTYRERLLGS
jgi:two-component system LytT family response regulator